MIHCNDQDTPSPPPRSTSPVHRGKHETFDDYFKRVLLYDKTGRHEVPTKVDRTTHINLYGELGVDTTGHSKGNITHFGPSPVQARITRYEAQRIYDFVTQKTPDEEAPTE